MQIPRYSDPDWKDQRPPSLIGEGARVDPNWLMKFLKNPALDEKDTDRDKFMSPQEAMEYGIVDKVLERLPPALLQTKPESER